MAKIRFSERSMALIEVEGGKVFSNFKQEKYNFQFSSFFFYCDLTTAGNVTMENSDL